MQTCIISCFRVCKHKSTKKYFGCIVFQSFYIWKFWSQQSQNIQKLISMIHIYILHTKNIRPIGMIMVHASVVSILVLMQRVHIGVVNQPLVIVLLRSMTSMMGLPPRWWNVMATGLTWHNSVTMVTIQCNKNAIITLRTHQVDPIVTYAKTQG